jgi:hypothetical protein
MTHTHHHRTIPVVLALMLACATAMILPAGALAAQPPVKEILATHIGGEVNQTTKANICTVQSTNTCQPGKPSSQPDGFERPLSVAGAPAPSSNIYVLDSANHRVQELTATGGFVAMFGWEVNQTRDNEPKATQAEKNVCSEEEIKALGVKCKTGVGGTLPGQFGEQPVDIAVDPASGEVYVAEILFVNGLFGERVQKFAAAGRFILEIGKEVNETIKGNICTQQESEKGVKCTHPLLAHTLTSEPGGAFYFTQGQGNLLAVGGPEDLLYVGDQHRVQEFETTATSMRYKGEIPLTSISSTQESRVSALTVDKTGDVYLVYTIPGTPSNIIREFNQAGKEIKEYPAVTGFENIAVDSAGRLAVTESGTDHRRGVLYEAGGSSLRVITEFNVENNNGIGFNSKDELFVASSSPGQEVVGYTPVPVAELVTGAALCRQSGEQESNVTLDCALGGEVNPEGVSQTEVWFQWGRTPALGSQTAKQPIGELEPLKTVSAVVRGVRPNEAFYYRLAGYDQHVEAPELLAGRTVSFTTPSVPPRIVGQASVSYVHQSSAVMFGELDPENTNTRYYFQYGACETLENCATIGQTTVQESPQYGIVAATVEATGLQPNTIYHYRLVANNQREVAGKQVGGQSDGPQGTFTTAVAPAQEATTRDASGIGTSVATVFGTVNPDGKAATYTFELGIYNGAGTQYGIVYSAQAGASPTPVGESLALSGLQPGTTYAYRIDISSGYITNPEGILRGQTRTFTTEGLPAVLPSPTPLGMLSIPSIEFPKTTVTKTKKTNTKKTKSKPKKKGKHIKRRAAPKSNAHKQPHNARGR